ncbi:rhodanese-like domain-containing protein [Anoxybacillus sp. J5B_2022]|uniref:rhodanese-like domain-containing protein n=1 Tax=Anoxybacillus sp. J5B_2022 TaxID=3003246 RepID=UPI0022869A79|nr:rhodanese-like domain-containing protein [Anoxybacillus sp. J5B_2022]MCZ0755070.1 rhodanese-like domain-containing protein [Anoxybacillus sp. J5B_2022]
MKKFALFLISLLLATGCSTKSGYIDVSVDEAEKMIADGKVEVIDVRTEEEFTSGHIPNAKLIPLQQLQNKLHELDKNKSYLIVCRSGNRSTQASNILVKEGFFHVYNMSGGMNEWKGAIEQ